MEKNVEREDSSKIYEIGFLLLPTIAEERIGETVTKIKDVLVKHGVAILAEDIPKLQRLSYLMTKKISGANKRFDTAYFGWVKFETTPSEAVVIKKELDGHTDILRLMLITTVKESTLFSARVAERESAQGIEKEPVSTEELDKSIEKTVEELAV